MKNITLLLFIIISNNFLWGQVGQAEYKIELYGLTYSVNAGVKNSTSSHLLLEVVYNDGSREELYYRHLGENGDNENNWGMYPPRTSSKLPVSIHTEGFVNFRTGTDASYDQYDVINICNQGDYNVDSHSPRMSWISFKMRATPIHTLVSLTDTNSINTFLPSDDKVDLYAKQGFAANLYHYQYSLDNVNWVNINSSLSTLNKLSVSAKDLLGTNYTQYVGQNIYLRVASCLSNGVYQSVSSPVVLTITQSAPHISSSSVTPTKCFDTADGTVMLNFDRTLLPWEILKIELENTVTEAAIPLPNDGYITNYLQLSNSHTLQNLPPGTYKLNILGTFNNNATYTDSSSHTINFEITKPTPVLFDSPSKTNVFCFQGNDGIINLTASGGQNQYQYWVLKDGQPFLDWTNFNNGNSTSLQNLSFGIYTIKVRDSNQCIAKEPTNSSVEKGITVTITQPAQAIDLPTSDIEIVQPTGYGLSNGYISLRVIGGTPNSDGSYNFEWRKDTPTGAVISTGITTDAVNNPYTIKLDNLTAGNYYLTVKDKNYANATSQLQNCGIILQEFIVTQPDPLIATIEVQKQISCNIANNYPYKLDLNGNGIPDEVEDGTLKTVVTGGVGAYSYQWQVFSGGTFRY
jgi:hypothetical protein